jgi:hypothetical protein
MINEQAAGPLTETYIHILFQVNKWHILNIINIIVRECSPTIAVAARSKA